MTQDRQGEGSFELKVEKDTSPAEAARMALKQEKRARRFYEECALVMTDPAARKMFEFLASEEKKHEDLIQGEIDRSFLAEM